MTETHTPAAPPAFDAKAAQVAAIDRFRAAFYPLGVPSEVLAAILRELVAQNAVQLWPGDAGLVIVQYVPDPEPHAVIIPQAGGLADILGLIPGLAAFARRYGARYLWMPAHPSWAEFISGHGWQQSPGGFHYDLGEFPAGAAASWAACSAWLDPARVDATEAEIVAEIETDQAQLWPGDRAAMLTSLNHDLGEGSDPEPTLLVWLGGGDLADLLAMRPGVEAWARAQGAKAIRINGRKGWTRALERVGFRPEGDQLRKGL